MALEDELQRLAKQLGITDPAKIDEFVQKIKDLLGDKGADDIAEKLGEILGKFGRGAAMGAGGAALDPEIIKKLIELLGPAFSDILDRIMRKIFGDGSGFTVTSPGPSPYKRERLRNPARDTADVVDTLAPDIDLNSTPRIECVGNDRIRITLTVSVVQREERLAKIQAIVNGSTGAEIDGRVFRPGESSLPRTPEDDTPYSIEFSFEVPCSEAIRSLGILIVTIYVEDVDGNQMINFLEIDLAAQLLNPDERCCKTFKDEEIRRGLLEALLRTFRGLTGADIERLIQLLDPRTSGGVKMPVPTEPAEDPTPKKTSTLSPTDDRTALRIIDLPVGTSKRTMEVLRSFIG
jgi:hypothetical protein